MYFIKTGILYRPQEIRFLTAYPEFNQHPHTPHRRQLIIKFSVWSQTGHGRPEIAKKEKFPFTAEEIFNIKLCDMLSTVVRDVTYYYFLLHKFLSNWWRCWGIIWRPNWSMENFENFFSKSWFLLMFWDIFSLNTESELFTALLCALHIWKVTEQIMCPWWNWPIFRFYLQAKL
jgi:hypothetical protein